MQGTAADIIKRAMITVDQWCTGTQGAVTLIMQVHDELVFEVGDGAVADARQHIPKLMSEAAALRVALKVDVGTGRNWDEAH